VRLGLAVAIRAEESHIIGAIVQEIAVYVINMQAQRFAVPGNAEVAPRAPLRNPEREHGSAQAFAGGSVPIGWQLDQHLLGWLAVVTRAASVMHGSSEVRGIDPERLELPADVRV
jgi:hypothetical protein